MAIPPLPPGQRETPHFPRFGLIPFATRFPSQTGRISLHLSFPDGGNPATAPAVTTDVGSQLMQLPRIEQTSDFHCVTTWTRRGLCWSGFRFADFYEQIVVPLCPPDPASGLAADSLIRLGFLALISQKPASHCASKINT